MTLCKIMILTLGLGHLTVFAEPHSESARPRRNDPMAENDGSRRDSGPDYVTHKKTEGNADIENARLVILCHSKKNEALMERYKKDGDTALGKILQRSSRSTVPNVSTSVRSSSPQRVAPPSGVKIDNNEYEAIANNPLQREALLTRNPAHSTELMRFFWEIDIAQGESNAIARQKPEHSESACSEEERAAMKVLRALASAKSNSSRVFLEVDCSQWNHSPLLKQLAKPYKHIVLEEKSS